MRRGLKHWKADRLYFFAKKRRQTMKEFFVAMRTPDAAGLSVSAFFTAVAAALGKIPVILILFMAAEIGRAHV